MKKKLLFIVLVAGAALLTACQESSEMSNRVSVALHANYLHPERVDFQLPNASAATMELTIQSQDTPWTISNVPDWITVSPKSDWIAGAEPVLEHADEIKVVYTGQDVTRWEKFDARYHYLQPCSCSNTKEVVTFVLSHPLWQLSLQSHKYLDIR